MPCLRMYDGMSVKAGHALANCQLLCSTMLLTMCVCVCLLNEPNLSLTKDWTEKTEDNSKMVAFRFCSSLLTFILSVCEYHVE